MVEEQNDKRFYGRGSPGIVTGPGALTLTSRQTQHFDSAPTPAGVNALDAAHRLGSSTQTYPHIATFLPGAFP